jgi:uncharacterized membrane-anchored protein YhcB (DUF1043 family)
MAFYEETELGGWFFFLLYGVPLAIGITVGVLIRRFVDRTARRS